MTLSDLTGAPPTAADFTAADATADPAAADATADPTAAHPTAPGSVHPTTAPADPATAGSRWESWHLHVDSLAPQALETALLSVLAPALSELAGPDGGVPPWFFIRYWQGGPHLRLRVADCTAAQRDRLVDRLRAGLATVNAGIAGSERISQASYLAAAVPISALGQHGPAEPVEPLLPAGVHRVGYQPEYSRYGGADLIAVTEQLFHASSVVTLRACRQRASFAQHVADGLESMAATLSAWPGDRLTLLRAVTDGWAPWVADQSATIARFAELAGPNRSALHRLAAGAPSRWSPWTRRLAAATQLWIDRHGIPKAAQIVGSHLHMTQNRLGVGGAREGIIAATLLRLLATSAD
jgi:hypothetical protein